MKYLRLLALLMLVPVSCVREELPERMVELRFGIDGTKSSLLGGESDISTFTVFAYSSGLLESSVTWKSGSAAPGLRLVSGRPYDLYAIANVEAPDMPLCESDLPSYRCGMDMELGIPMAWSSLGRVFSDSGTIYLDFIRLAARLDLLLDKTALNGARIKSVSLRQAMKECLAFGSGCKALRPVDVEDGDCSPEEDLDVLNAGGKISLYALENCQGVLLPRNLQSWKKVPPEEYRGLCTYLEIVCEFLDGSPIQGEAIYRIYPGKDDLRDFTLQRNNGISIQLKLTDVGLDMAVSLVENNTDYRPGLADYRLAEGLHDVDDMYVGEMLKFLICPSEELLSFWSEGRFTDSSIVLGYEDSEGIHRVEDCMEISAPFYEDGDWYFSVYVLSIVPVHSSCGFYLYDDTDKRLVSRMGSLSSPDRDMSIRTAFLGIAPLDGQGRCIQAPSGQISHFPITINGPEERLGLYLMDEEGNIFPNDGTSTFNPYLYSTMSASYVPDRVMQSDCSQEQRNAVLDCCEVELQMGNRNYPYPFCTASCRITNDGSIAHANQGLSIVLSRPWALSLNFTCRSLVSMMQDICVEALPWKAWLIGEHSDCGFALNPQPGNITQLALHNPSHIDLDLYLGLFLHADYPAKPDQRYFIDSSSDFRDAWMSRLERVVEAYAAASVSGERLSCYSARLDGYDVDVYRVQYGYSYYCDLSSVYNRCRNAYFQNLADGSGMAGAGCGTCSEARLQSLGGHVAAGSTFTDLTGTGGGDDFSRMRYRGMSLWENGALVSTAEIDPLGPHDIEDLRRVVSGQGVDFGFSWDSSGNLYCSIGDDGGAGRSYRISVRPVYYVYLRYTPDGGSTYYYLNNDHGFSNFPELYSISWRTDSRLTSKASYSAPAGSEHRMAWLAPMEKEMALINRTYWLASSSRSSYYDTGTGLISINNRWSTMALPQRIDMELSITCDSPDWVPVNLTLASVTMGLEGYEFYEKTENGYFAVYGGGSSSGRPSAGLNPDGSPRTNGAEGMQAGKKAILPEITSSAAASNVIPMSDCVVELAYSDVGISRVSYR